MISTAATIDPVASPRRPHPRPAPAGDPGILAILKSHLGIPRAAGDPGEVATTPIGPDGFPLRADSPLAVEHGWLSELMGVQPRSRLHSNKSATLAGSGIGAFLLKQDLSTFGRLMLAAAERHAHGLIGPSPAATPARGRVEAVYFGRMVSGRFMQAQFALERAGLFDLFVYLAAIGLRCGYLPSWRRLELLFAQVEVEAARTPLTEGERYALSLLRAAGVGEFPQVGEPDEDLDGLNRLIGDEAYFFLVPGEDWCDAVNADLAAMGADRRGPWEALLRHALKAYPSRPSGRWLSTGADLVAGVGGDEVQAALARWLPLVPRGRTVRPVPGVFYRRRVADAMVQENATCLRGLLRLVPTLPRPADLAREVGGVALAAYRKVPGLGPLSVKVGNSAVAALASLDTPTAIGQLAPLKARIKVGSAQRAIDKAFAVAAAASGLLRDEIEELGVPSYGLEEVGRRAEAIGEYRAELIVDGSDAELRWFDPKGKALKAVPAKVKAEHKDDLKEWQDALKDIRAMLPAQRDRLDGLTLARRSWPIGAWRERYGDHPLVGTIARRLIWRVDGNPVVFADGTPTDVAGRPIEPGPAAEVTTWHPVDCPVEEVLAWRDRLEALGITQPFKQAHREVYLLTDAERRTNTYSNRFAAHVIRQHQFNALCAARGWKNQLRLMVDASYHPPSKELPAWSLRAEFLVEGIGDAYGADTNEAGVYLRLATDQVRFYRAGATAGPGEADVNEPLPLDQIPPLVLSEVLRDVDLFVGVASVGNDPTWQDGGPGGRYQTYWQGYSFGELSGTAATRKQVLERLVPRLKIAARCSFTDRFLRVRGSKRAYKIHLGSGNILMEPNDQYLCIVPDGRKREGEGALFLPFEGDNLLSIILSKAFLLADDAKIQDPTILSQINR